MAARRARPRRVRRAAERILVSSGGWVAHPDWYDYIDSLSFGSKGTGATCEGMGQMVRSEGTFRYRFAGDGVIEYLHGRGNRVTGRDRFKLFRGRFVFRPPYGRPITFRYRLELVAARGRGKKRTYFS